MVNRRLKQIFAAAVGIVFVVSIMYGFASMNVGNPTQLAYEIIIPQSLVKPTSSLYTTGLVSNSSSTGQNLTLIGSVAYTPISSLNATTIGGLTNDILRANNMSASISGGQLTCIYSSQFTGQICDNTTTNSYWYLYLGLNGATPTLYSTNPLAPMNVKLSSVIGSTAFFVLQYQLGNNQNKISSTGGTPPPKI